MTRTLLFFTKPSLKNFVNEPIETMCFPDETVSDIYKEYNIEKVEMFHISTDTDSTSLKFIFICNPNSDISDNKYRDVIFVLIVASKIYQTFDSSHEFWSIFGARKSQKKKKTGYYDVKHIDDPCILILAVNSKEYLELFASKYLNKKHKGIKKGSSRLGFENFSKRIGSLVNFDTFNPRPHGKKQISRLTVISGEMVKSAVTKNKFLLLNDKRFYFPDGLVSLPFYHPILAEIDNFKQKKC